MPGFTRVERICIRTEHLSVSFVALVVAFGVEMRDTLVPLSVCHNGVLVLSLPIHFPLYFYNPLLRKTKLQWRGHHTYSCITLITPSAVLRDAHLIFIGCSCVARI